MLSVLFACGGSPSQGPSAGTNPPGGGNPPVGPPTTVYTADDGTRFGVQTLATGLQIPWSLGFAPDGRLFISERPGRVTSTRTARAASSA
jgi:glucose/arabinose dehydrogenase